MTRIVGLVLVRNEENFVTWAIGNVLAFCDEIIVIDNMSRDGTSRKLEAMAARHDKIRLHRDARAGTSNRYVQPYLGRDVWMLGVDGDEIYDREALARLRARLLAGELSQFWSVSGHTINATLVDLAAGTASGYVTPTAAPATKLYNMARIRSWHANTQRLHGAPVLEDGSYGKQDAGRLSRLEDWDNCDLRNLHLCFFPRSGLDSGTEVRRNITDKSLRNVLRRPLFGALQALGLDRGRLGAYLAPRSRLKKLVRYARGDLECRSVAGMGRPGDFALDAADGEQAEAVLAAVSKRRQAQPDLRESLA